MLSDDEKKLQNYLEASNSTLVVEPFSKVEKRKGKTPDFKVYTHDTFSFYCEVKSVDKDGWLDSQIQNKNKGELAGGSRNDPIFNRLTDDIYKAMKQFDAVNKNKLEPNVLVIINHDKNCGVNDLLAVLTGNFYAQNGASEPIYKKFSDGRIENSTNIIDLFIWLDDNKPTRLLFSQTNQSHHLLLCKVFNMNLQDIKQISR